MSVVRASKFRHIFAKDKKKEQWYEGFSVTNCASDGNFIAANGTYVAFCVSFGGGGTFMVVPVEKTGRLDIGFPKVSAHREYVLDLQWDPFNDNIIASCSEDGTIKIWEVPDKGFLTNVDDSKALLKLEHHERKCVQIQWHPIAKNVLLSVSQEPKVCVWNLDEGEVVVEIEDFPDNVFNASWNAKGDKIVTACKDKQIRIFNARNGELLVKGMGHEGSKPSRAIFILQDEFILTCGFSRMGDRQYAVRKINGDKLEEVGGGDLDTSNGCLIPYYDADNNVVFLGAKGDSAIRYYEVVNEDPYIHYLSIYQSKSAQRGLGPIPKRSVDVNCCEVMKFYKLVSDKKSGNVQPLSFTVPRKSDLFQEDIYPDAISDEAAITADEWLSGKNIEPNRIEMSMFYAGKTRSKTGGGGLKGSGGLKGLKAGRKESRTEEPKDKDSSPETKRSVSRSESASSTKSSIGGNSESGDSKIVKELQSELKSLKENDEKMQKDIKDLKDKLKLMCDAVKKTDDRIVALEEMVQEEEDEDDK